MFLGKLVKGYLTKSPFSAGVPEYWMLISSPWLAHTVNRKGFKKLRTVSEERTEQASFRRDHKTLPRKTGQKMHINIKKN